MSSKRIKRYLMLLAALGLVAIALGGSGTFASFNAEVTNSDNYFQTGTLLLHDTPNGGTECKSEDDSTNNAYGSCTFLFHDDLSGGAQTATLELQNDGTLTADDIKFKVAGCTVGTNNAATGSNVTFGTAPSCSDLDITIQETDEDYDAGTNVYCAYGPTTNGTDCDAPDNTATLATAASFQTLQTTGPVDATLTGNGGTPGNGQARYYVIEVAPNVTYDNSLQNRKVSFGLTWHIDHA